MKASITRRWSGLSARGKAGVVAAIVVVLAVAYVTNPPAPGQTTTSPSAAAAQSTDAVTAVPSPPATATNAPAPTTTTTAEPTDRPAATENSVPPTDTFPGVTAADMKSTLEQRGFRCEGPEDAGLDGITFTCKSAAEYVVLLRATDPNDLFYVDSTATGVSKAQAADFLATMAAMPCDGCRPEEASAWVKANIDASEADTTIGGVYYVFYPSGDAAWVLEMSMAD